ncbi:MAG TPA: pyridoxamine 5'-phosphate oxidase [Polyangiaceae bacterium]|nr:pyridoxamine 5'-phosphate oxidase [Polyangiaceae bacterium]
MRDAPNKDPLQAVVDWHREAQTVMARDPDAMTLATATRDGAPSARIVLFKGVDAGEILFVTNYSSRKGQQIDENPAVALVFYWPELMRQIRVEGIARRSPVDESEAYFRSRPRESQLGAWASAQSTPIASRAELEQRFAAAAERFGDRDVERPPYWGMYRVRPQRIELWLGGAHRLHDRFQYDRNDESWSVTRLSP